METEILVFFFLLFQVVSFITFFPFLLLQTLQLDSSKKERNAKIQLTGLVMLISLIIYAMIEKLSPFLIFAYVLNHLSLVLFIKPRIFNNYLINTFKSIEEVDGNFRPLFIFAQIVSWYGIWQMMGN